MLAAERLNTPPLPPTVTVVEPPTMPLMAFVVLVELIFSDAKVEELPVKINFPEPVLTFKPTTE